MDSTPQSLISRKQQHVELCVQEDVRFRHKTTGLERIDLEYCALPEIDASDVQSSTELLGKQLSIPLIISGMTGGYEGAERINAELAEVCEEKGIAMGVGSQRQALLSERFHESYRAVRRFAPSIAVISNIGATELVQGQDWRSLQRVCALVQANALAVHLNPLQELLQPEGTPKFRGVLKAIARLVRESDIPIIVKEVGAGISAAVAKRLLEAGVRYIDVAGAGGTSWSGVELLRSETKHLDELWDAGIPTAECLDQIRPLKQHSNLQLIASGGIQSGFEIAKCIALGADIAGSARPLLRTLVSDGQDGLRLLIEQWSDQLRAQMFACGVASISALQTVSWTERRA